MKKIILFTLVLSTFNAWAEIKCVKGADPAIFECTAASPELQANGCQVPVPESNSNVEMINDELKAKACEESDPWKGMSHAEKNLKRKELNQLCKKEAKAYKRSVFNSLFKKGKFGQSLQVVFKRKSKISRGKVDNEISGDVANMSDEQLKAFLNAEITKLESETDEGEQSHTVPFNISINDGDGINCTVKAKVFPEEPPHVTPDCIACEPLDLLSSFTNDC